MSEHHIYEAACAPYLPYSVQNIVNLEQLRSSRDSIMTHEICVPHRLHVGDSAIGGDVPPRPGVHSAVHSIFWANNGVTKHSAQLIAHDDFNSTRNRTRFIGNLR